MCQNLTNNLSRGLHSGLGLLGITTVKKKKRACYDTPWVVWKVIEFYKKVEKKMKVMRHRTFTPTEIRFFFYLYII